jgi:hypothetical protein
MDGPGWYSSDSMLVGSGWRFGTFFIFHNIYGTILPIDELIFFKMVETTNQYDSVL